jgi:hypothetical protein
MFPQKQKKKTKKKTLTHVQHSLKLWDRMKTNIDGQVSSLIVTANDLYIFIKGHL